MAMRYDFGFGDAGSPGAAGRVAMFCDPQVVAAIERADDSVREFFVSSGFAIKAHDNGAPPGRFPEEDEEARAIVIERLSANLAAPELNGANWGGFDFSAFMENLAIAEPIVGELLAPTTFGHETQTDVLPQAPAKRPIGAMIVLGIGLLLLLYVASQLIL